MSVSRRNSAPTPQVEGRVKSSHKKTKILLFLIVLAFFTYGGDVIGYNIAKQEQADAQSAAVAAQKPDLYDLWVLINDERTKAGEPPVRLDPYLLESSVAHCNDMVNQNYWDHNNPQGKTPDQWINDINYHPQFSIWGENLAYNNSDATAVAKALFDSEGHRNNTLNPKFTDVGLATCNAPNYPNIVVEQFIERN